MNTKKLCFLIGIIFCFPLCYSQLVTAVTVDLPYNSFEVGVNDIWIDTGIVIKSTVTPASAADKTVKFTIDSGDACYFVIDTTPGKLTCTKAGAIRIKAAAQDGSGITKSRTVTVKQIVKVNSYRLYFNNNNLNILSDEHYLDPVTHPGEAPKIYKFSIDSNALRIDIDKIGPESAPRSGIPVLSWKTFPYGFAPMTIRLAPCMGVALDMSAYKKVRIKMRGANSRGHINTTPATLKAPDFRFQITPCTKNINCCSGGTGAITGDTVNYTKYLYDMNGTTGAGLYDSSNIRYFFIKINDGITYDASQGWSQTESARSNDFKGTIWIEWIAFGAAADTVLMESITISGVDSAIFVPFQILNFTAAVAPLDATDKVFFWSTSDPSVGTIDGSGKLTMKKAGTIQVIATAQDGSGVISTHALKLIDTVTVKPCSKPVPISKDTAICSGKTATLKASGGVNYRWYNNSAGGSIIGTGASYTTPVLDSNTTYYVSNYDSCESSRKAVVVNVSNLSAPKISALKNSHFDCHSSPEQLSATPSGGTFSGDGVELDFFIPSQAKENHVNSIYYAIEDTISGCKSIDSLHVFVFSCVGLKNDQENGLKIYPNPTNGIITIEIKEVNEELSVQVLDELGRVLFEDKKSDITNYSANIDLSGYPAGVYVVKARMKNNIVMKKIVKW